MILPWPLRLVTMVINFLILRIWCPFIFWATFFSLENLLVTSWTTNTFSLWSITSFIIVSITFVSIRIEYWRLPRHWCFSRWNEWLRILLEELLCGWERIALLMISLIMVCLLTIFMLFGIACGLIISHIMPSWATTTLWLISCRRVIFVVFRSWFLI